MPDQDRRTPEWLTSSIPEKTLPIRQILDGCLYYPACALDGQVFSRTWKWAPTHSFVLVDYSISRDRLIEELKRPIERGGEGLLGYRLAFHRHVKREELGVPPSWSPPRLMPHEVQLAVNAAKNAMRFSNITEPYCEWAVFDRLPERDENHGPNRLSILFLCADGVAAYHALFHTHKVAPKTLVIKQPGTGFGGNWTDFFEEGKPMHNVVSSLGIWPQHLIFGGRGESSWYLNRIWKGYQVIAADGLPDQSLIFAKLKDERQGS